MSDPIVSVASEYPPLAWEHIQEQLGEDSMDAIWLEMTDRYWDMLTKAGAAFGAFLDNDPITDKTAADFFLDATNYGHDNVVHHYNIRDMVQENAMEAIEEEDEDEEDEDNSSPISTISLDSRLPPLSDTDSCASATDLTELSPSPSTANADSQRAGTYGTAPATATAIIAKADSHPGETYGTAPASAIIANADSQHSGTYGTAAASPIIANADSQLAGTYGTAPASAIVANAGSLHDGTYGTASPSTPTTPRPSRRKTIGKKVKNFLKALSCFA